MALLYCIVLYCIVLYCSALYCIAVFQMTCVVPAVIIVFSTSRVSTE